MRILFAGTPDIAVPSLDALVESRHEVVGVVTAPDRERGRGRTVSSSAVKRRAEELRLPILQPDRLDAGARASVAALAPEALACFAYGRIFGPRFLALFARGALNVHPSLLPRYRGPAPIPAAIRNGDDETGVTVQTMAQEMDAGDIVVQTRIPLDGSETTGSLSTRIAPLAGTLLVRAFDLLEAGRAEFEAQDHAAATYTKLLEKSDGEIDWRRPAVEIERLVRATYPWPRAVTTLRGELLMIIAAAVPESRASAVVPGRVCAVDTTSGILVETGDGVLALQKLQLQSRKPLDWRDFVNGVPDIVGRVLGGP